MSSTPYTQQSQAQLVGYPCAMRCGKVLRVQEDGVAFKIRSWQFATCHDCAPKVVGAARVVGNTVREGLVRAGLSLVDQNVPALGPVVRALLGKAG